MLLIIMCTIILLMRFIEQRSNSFGHMLNMDKYLFRKRGRGEDEESGSSSKRALVESSSESPLTWNTSLVTRLVHDKNGLHVVYYPSFLPNHLATATLKQLNEELLPYFNSPTATKTVKIMGKECAIPRQQASFGDDGLSYTFSGVTVPALPWPPTVFKLKETTEKAIGHTFNFVLVNHYRSGLDHMGEHRDDERDLCPEAPIASLSFGAERSFVFRHKDARGKDAPRRDIDPVKLSLRHGSLLLMCPPTNRNWYHSLPVRKKVTFARINLTFRRMLLKK